MTDDDTTLDGQPPSPCLGGPILSPCKKKDWMSGVSCFDVEQLSIPLYHGKENGVALLNTGYLVHCGFNMISTDDGVMCFSNIILAHCRIQDMWHSSVANTYGPQVDCILLKSFQLFPILELTTTEDVVNFYDQFQELSTSHLLAVMPFDAIVLKNCYKGLCILGLGTRRYMEMSRALVDFLPWLIPGTLLSRINATLTAVHCKSNNRYNNFW